VFFFLSCDAWISQGIQKLRSHLGRYGAGTLVTRPFLWRASAWARPVFRKCWRTCCSQIFASALRSSSLQVSHLPSEPEIGSMRHRWATVIIWQCFFEWQIFANVAKFTQLSPKCDNMVHTGAPSGCHTSQITYEFRREGRLSLYGWGIQKLHS